MIGPRPLAIAEPVVAAPHLHHLERGHDGVVEALGGGDVGDRDGDVVEHGSRLEGNRWMIGDRAAAAQGMEFKPWNCSHELKSLELLR